MARDDRGLPRENTSKRGLKSGKAPMTVPGNGGVTKSKGEKSNRSVQQYADAIKPSSEHKYD